MKKASIALVASLVLFAGALVPVAMAQISNPTGPTPGYLSNPIQASSFTQLFTEIFTALTSLGYVLVVLAIVYCGFLFVAAQGNEEKLRTARSALLWTIIGGLVILGASLILTVVQNTAQSL